MFKGFNQEEVSMKVATSEGKGKNSDASRKNKGLDLDDEFILSTKVKSISF